MTIMECNPDFLRENYDDFISTLYRLSEQGELPAVFRVEDLEGITLQDIEDVMKSILEETCFAMDASMFICSRCGKMHLDLEVYLPDYEDYGIPLQ